MVDVGVAQQHRGAEGKFLMEEEEGEEQLGGEAVQGGAMLRVGGEHKRDGEEETEEAEGTRPADNQVDPSPSLSLAAYIFFQELSMMHLKSDGQLH